MGLCLCMKPDRLLLLELGLASLVWFSCVVVRYAGMAAIADDVRILVDDFMSN